MNNDMEMKYIEYKRENCVYYKRKIVHDIRMLLSI